MLQNLARASKQWCGVKSRNNKDKSFFLMPKDVNLSKIPLNFQIKPGC